MIAWLQRQTVPSYRLLAGELIAYGATSTPDAVVSFCAAFPEWASWAASDFSEHIFHRSAAALAELLNHACSASVLVQVASDELVTLRRRIIAAQASANAGYPYIENGVAILRHVLADQGTGSSDRRSAAESLARLGRNTTRKPPRRCGK